MCEAEADQEELCGGMPMSGAMWDVVEHATEKLREKRELSKKRKWKALDAQASMASDFWFGYAGAQDQKRCRLEESLALGKTPLQVKPYGEQARLKQDQ